MFKFIRNVVIRSIVICAVVAGLSYGGYWICKGLAWATTHLTAVLTQFGTYVKTNVPALITIIVLVTIANIIFEVASKRFQNNEGSRKTRQRKVTEKDGE